MSALAGRRLAGLTLNESTSTTSDRFAGSSSLTQREISSGYTTRGVTWIQIGAFRPAASAIPVRVNSTAWPCIIKPEVTGELRARSAGRVPERESGHGPVQRLASFSCGIPWAGTHFAMPSLAAVQFIRNSQRCEVCLTVPRINPSLSPRITLQKHIEITLIID